MRYNAIFFIFRNERTRVSIRLQNLIEQLNSYLFEMIIGR